MTTDTFFAMTYFLKNTVREEYRDTNSLNSLHTKTYSLNYYKCDRKDMG